mmetsp:Transcript_33904/g.79116  ORF Transcript_33904/g.79116 Transcript_33904/m.79116 type:complete len:334 (+) Transcript_33904:321-1322(+)
MSSSEGCWGIFQGIRCVVDADGNTLSGPRGPGGAVVLREELEDLADVGIQHVDLGAEGAGVLLDGRQAVVELRELGVHLGLDAALDSCDLRLDGLERGDHGRRLRAGGAAGGGEEGRGAGSGGATGDKAGEVVIDLDCEGVGEEGGKGVIARAEEGAKGRESAFLGALVEEVEEVVGCVNVLKIHADALGGIDGAGPGSRGEANADDLSTVSGKGIPHGFVELCQVGGAVDAGEAAHDVTREGEEDEGGFGEAGGAGVAWGDNGWAEREGGVEEDRRVGVEGEGKEAVGGVRCLVVLRLRQHLRTLCGSLEKKRRSRRGSPRKARARCLFGWC